MDLDRLDATIAEVNALASRHHWFDLEVWSYGGGELVVSGTGGWAWWSDLRIVFSNVCWASVRFQGWRSDTKRPILLRVEGVEAVAVNTRFDIDSGLQLFKFVAEGGAEPMWIAAREITVDPTHLELGTKPPGLP